MKTKEILKNPYLHL